MATRIHIVLDDSDKARYRAQASREGKTLGAWLRAAAEDRLSAATARRDLRSRSGLEEFFAECDRREGGREPDWEGQLVTIERSRLEGLDVT